MTATPTLGAAVDPPLGARMAIFVRHLPQRVGERHFWVTQAGVLAVTAVHVLAELWAVEASREVPTAFHHIPVVLYLVPISFASLRYGMEGAVLTGLWSAALTLPNLFLWHREGFEWLEFVYVAVVILVGTVMSVPVDRERQQRQRAEATLQRQVLLGDIATLTLTADLRTTVDQTLRRLLDVLDLEATCVAVTDPDDRAELTVLACHGRHADAGEALTAGVRGHRSRGAPDAPAPADDDVVVVPVTADLPASGPEGRVDGVLAVRTNPARPLTEDDHRLLAGVASHVAVAIANERLTESERNRLRSYTMLVTRAQEEERKRIARELHDEASQNLVVIRRGLDGLAGDLGDHPAAAELAELGDLAGQTVAGIRRFSRDLRPPTLDELGLASALQQLVAQVRDQGGLAIACRVEGPYRRLPIETELTIFRIGQAALHNVERHAAATAVDVVLSFEPDRVRLRVVDDGCGFELPQNLAELPRLGKLGLLGMRERAQLVGGVLQLHSRPGDGTRVHLEVPVDRGSD